MNIIECTFAQHAVAILDILNEAILNSTAIYDYKPRSPDSMVSWFQAKATGSYPVLGVRDQHGQLAGFATYSAFRSWPAYKYTVEHSVYVHMQHRGRGLGRVLLERLIAAATQQGYHALIGGIDLSNSDSIALHEKLGFAHAGTLKQVGFKFGRWLDLAFYQLLLNTPTLPTDA